MGKINSRIDGTTTRSIIHFTKNVFFSGFDDLDIDIKLKGKTDPQTTIYVVVYGVSGSQNDVDPLVWDRFYYIENQIVHFEAPIDLKDKDITSVNKIVTDDLDVNGKIDMKFKKIINLGYGIANKDAVNKLQLDAVKRQVTSQVTTVINQVTQNKTDIATINTNNGYYYFTDQLKHDNSKIVIFPSRIRDSYPYSDGIQDSDGMQDSLRISLDGHYHVIYTDFYKKKWSIYNS